MGDYERNRGGGGNLAAAFMGMIIGAVGAATAIFVSRKENRDMLKDRVDELRIKGQKAVGELKKGVEKAKDEASKSVEEAEEEIKKDRGR